MSGCKPYPSDSSDEQWSLIEPVLSVWKDRYRSVIDRQGDYVMREIVNSILCQGRTGCQWAFLPHDLPPKSAMYYCFAARRDDGTDQVVHERLRCQVRERAHRLEDPTLVVLDTRSVHAAAGIPSSTTGRDPAMRVPGRKRALAVHGSLVGIDVESVERTPHQAGFVPQPKRWRVEQAYGILLLHWRPVRDCEHRPSSSTSRVHRAMTRVMARRLTGANTPTWRDPKAVTA